MPYSVDLAFRVEEALAELPEDGLQEVMETIAATLVHRDAWPAQGGWDTSVSFGPRSVDGRGWSSLPTSTASRS
ncbi:hypothetical protein [Streptomyces sasae]|uniref:hypothetical protein n=1 Tax=Streptomyces sasae TaxID=1266772 RepID=UPI00292E8BAC|nr:hypothetical protein [Streptomyces sasae]